MFGSVAPILDKDDDESPYGDAFKVRWNFKFIYVRIEISSRKKV